ncbi:hypothetical protein M011DRAFT_526015 [Sporormia fimetaria CBS 119925]|uniref:Glycoside hydrolase family 18 protein n=1 Tax=Sporormia fimetaria CBS 119925 TaxID=1340428 RepID=A0A6A6VB75_9PLEO|nr:hypothetical protein M011DRAFT_526015 [Sporormia fimetaria CBS 119925]
MFSQTFKLLLLYLLVSLVNAEIGDRCYHEGAAGTCQKTSKCSSGATVRGLCPNDPDDVRCCFPNYPCNLDTFPGKCLDKTKNTCNGPHGYISGLCPGNNDVQCCLSKSTVDKFLDFVETTYNLAVQYKNGNSAAKKSSNELVMEWIRHEAYNDAPWKILIGGVDSDWIAFAKGKGHPMFEQFADPHFCGQFIGTDHLFASMNAAFRFPPLEDPLINRGDMGGWGGDLVTLYAEWHDAGQPPPRIFAEGRILGNEGTFKLEDFIQDVDAFHMGVGLSVLPAPPIHVVTRNYYKPKGPYRTRFSRFLEDRFGDRAGAKKIAYNMLAGDGYTKPGDKDSVVVALRTGAIQKTAPFTPLPSMIDRKILDLFIDGFIDALESLAADKGKAC